MPRLISRHGARLLVTRLAPPGYCVNLFTLLLVRDPSWIGPKVINHERIHNAQQRELLFIPFYLLYLLEWIIRLIQYRDFYRAYVNISFEREAYANGPDLGYISRRHHYAWLKYV